MDEKSKGTGGCIRYLTRAKKKKKETPVHEFKKT